MFNFLKKMMNPDNFMATLISSEAVSGDADLGQFLYKIKYNGKAVAVTMIDNKPVADINFRDIKTFQSSTQDITREKSNSDLFVSIILKTGTIYKFEVIKMHKTIARIIILKIQKELFLASPIPHTRGV